jgi:hypothetical protein
MRLCGGRWTPRSGSDYVAKSPLQDASAQAGEVPRQSLPLTSRPREDLNEAAAPIRMVPIYLEQSGTLVPHSYGATKT